jgi:hypothetical protein
MCEIHSAYAAESFKQPLVKHLATIESRELHREYGTAMNTAEAVTDSSVGECNREGRLYALRQLAQRAGVSSEFFRSWRVERRPSETTIYIQPGTRKCIRFKSLSPQRWQDLLANKWYTARANWMFTPPDSVLRAIPDFVVPFSFPEEGGDRTPLFSTVDSDTVLCDLDLLCSTLLTLARFEEIETKERDVHGRFAASMSIAYRDGFLDRPIVDEYGLGFEQALKYLLPSWQPRSRKLRVKLSHDIDTVGTPFRLRSALAHTIRDHRPSATARDLLGRLVGLRPTHLELVRTIAQLSLDRGVDSAIYWKASPAGPNDTGYDPCRREIREVVRWLKQREVENGVHPGYDTFLSPDRLHQEVSALRETLGERFLGGRQHYLRWAPQTWTHWEECGLAYDSTVGYADHVGFRAGTCFPYRPWLLWLNREATIIEIPLIVMDCVLAHSIGLNPQQSREAIRNCIARCRSVGGVFTLLWHNGSLIEAIYGDTYETVLDELAGEGRFDWRRPAEELY